MLFITILFVAISSALSCMQTVESSAQLPPPAQEELLINLQAADDSVSRKAAVVPKTLENKNINTARRSQPLSSDPVIREDSLAPIKELPPPPISESRNNIVQSRQIRQEPVIAEASQDPLEDSDINRHRKLFSQAISKAKTFSSSTETTQGRKSANTRKAHSAKTFEIVAAPQNNKVRDWNKELDRSTTTATSTRAEIAVSKSEETNRLNKVPEQHDMCANCPNLLMNTKLAASEICENWDAISSNFDMTMDKTEKVNIQDESELFQCKRSITCKEPHVIVKWLDFNLCDVHKAESGETFNYSCNGTHWFIKDYPIDQIICASNIVKGKGSN